MNLEKTSLFFKKLLRKDPRFLYKEAKRDRREIPLKENEKNLVLHIKRSIDNAYEERSKLDEEILALPGYSSDKVRHFLNNLLTVPNAKYLEIGCWKGSTLISALYKNQANITDAVAIDNWTEFGSPKTAFLLNCGQFLPNSKHRFYSMDCFDASAPSLFKDPINVYFYDGNHADIYQEKAFTHYNSVFENSFIAIIDDWNADHVRSGTYSAFDKLGYQILYEKYLPAKFNGDRKNWWNGLYVALIRKA